MHITTKYFEKGLLIEEQTITYDKEEKEALNHLLAAMEFKGIAVATSGLN